MIMQVLWLGLNAIIGAWLSHSVLCNPVLGFIMMQEWGTKAVERLMLFLITALFAAHVAVAVGVSLLVSVPAAVVATSMILFASSLMAYFMLQRFAGPLFRPMIVIRNPIFYSAIALAAFLACTVAVVMFCGWFWAVAPIGVWFVLGFVCAELAIRRLIARSKSAGRSGFDRRLAIFALNDGQGRRGLFGMDRYPFP